jgi:hypothetical protein
MFFTVDAIPPPLREAASEGDEDEPPDGLLARDCEPFVREREAVRRAFDPLAREREALPPDREPLPPDRAAFADPLRPPDGLREDALRLRAAALRAPPLAGGLDEPPPDDLFEGERFDASAICAPFP